MFGIHIKKGDIVDEITKFHFHRVLLNLSRNKGAKIEIKRELGP